MGVFITDYTFGASIVGLEPFRLPSHPLVPRTLAVGHMVIGISGLRVGQESPGCCCTIFSQFAEPGAIKHVYTIGSVVSSCLGFDTPHYSLQCWFSAFCIVYLRVKVNGRRHFSSRSPTLVFSRPLRGIRVGQESPGHCCTTFSQFAEPGAIKHVSTTLS